MTLFKGTDDQAPWPYVVGKHPEKALPYKGLAYMAGVIDLGNNASMPNFNFEVQGKLLETGDGVDVNPADYIRYILDKVGLKDIEIVGLDNYRRYCREADFLISTPSDYTNAKTARDIVNEIANLTNAYIFWSNDRFKIVPRADRAVGAWTPDRQIVYDLTADDFLEQIHARGKITEILGTQKYIQIIYLTVDINITQTLAVNQHPLLPFLLLFLQLSLVIIYFSLQSIAFFLQIISLCLQFVKVVHNLAKLRAGAFSLPARLLLAGLHPLHTLTYIIQLGTLVISSIGKAHGSVKRQHRQP